jgi:hypothetical protein
MTRDQFQQLMTSEYEKIIAINNTKGHDYAGMLIAVEMSAPPSRTYSGRYQGATSQASRPST